MTLRREIENFSDSFVSVLSSADGLEAGRNVDIVTELYPVQKIFPPGIWAGTHTGGTVRLLPRARLTAIAASGQAVLQLPPFLAGLFVVGDLLDTVTFSGTVPTFTNLGTVAAVDTVNHRLTLGANLASNLAADTVIAVDTSVPIGMLSPNTAIDVGMAQRPNTHFGVFTKAKVVRSRLPYHDPQILNLPGCLYTVREVS